MSEERNPDRAQIFRYFRYERWNKNVSYVIIFCASGDLIHLRNRSKLVQGSLYAIIDLLIGAKSITLYLIWRLGACFHKKRSSFKKEEFNLYFYN